MADQALRKRWIVLTALVGALAWLPLCLAADGAKPAASLQGPGLGDPGKLVKLAVTPAEVELRGSESRRQMIVDGHYSSGQVRDLTHQVSYQTSKPGIVAIDDHGFVKPLADGAVTVHIKAAAGVSTSMKIVVGGTATASPINFGNEIVPVLTKLGCNAGGCHGKLAGQNGFRLSLLGFYPQDDYEYLVKEDRGRRLFPASPERSLLVLKATSIVPHGGGQRLEPNSFEHQLLMRWIGQGMPFGSADDPTVTKIEVYPTARTLDRHSGQQLAVTAIFSDGTRRDVTNMAKFEPNNTELAEAAPGGYVKTLDLIGDVAVMVRYQSEVAVFRAMIPLGMPVDSAPAPRNFVDELVFGKLKTLGIPPSELCDDATFLRRVSLDIAGRLPTAEEAEAFLADKESGKRDKLIDRLLASGGYADFFANKWSNVLRNKRINERYTRGTYVFHEWIRDSLWQNKPYDQFVREIITASGEMMQNPPVAWYRAAPTQNEQLEDTAQLFLGMRIACARCHHHPYEKWGQGDYYGFAAFFSKVGRKKGQEFKEEESRIYHQRGEAFATNPRGSVKMKPTGLGAEPLEIKPEDDPRTALVDWMVDPSNPYFAKSLVNRYWKHFFGRGIVDPEDDMRVTNPPTNPELLDALAKHFIDSQYDLKTLIRTLCQSQAYQLSAVPNEYNARDKQNFSRYFPKRLSAEVLYDALNQVTGTTSTFNGLPKGTRAMQLPDSGFDNYFLNVFGKPQNDSACECERSGEANLAQTLHMLNSREVQNKLTDGEGRAALLARDKDLSDEERVGQLYYWAYARTPSADELKFSLAYLARPEFKEKKQQAVEDVLWALLNAKEFLFNH